MLCLSSTSFADWVALSEPDIDPVILTALNLMQHQEYRSADSVLKEGIDDSLPASDYFRGLCAFARYNDLGDTSALKDSRRRWERVYQPASGKKTAQEDAKTTLYRGLSALQLAYVAQIQGRKIQAARLGLAAADILDDTPQFLEARLAKALFDYYKAPLLNNFSWLPFVKNRDRTQLVAFLERHYRRSPYLGPLFRNSLIWAYFDAGNFQKGLSHIDAKLADHPENRLLRQMRADFLYRLNDFEGARALYETSKNEYAGISSLEKSNGYVPIGYLSSAGNLARIYRKLGDKEKEIRHLAIWNSEAAKPSHPYLPESLKKDLERLE